MQFYKECPSPKIVGTRSDPLSNWSILTGLLLVKPQALLQRESAHRELVFQARIDAMLLMLKPKAVLMA